MAFADQKTFSPNLTSFTCFIIFLAMLSSTQVTHSISDGEALLKFKSSLQNSNALSNWNPNTSPCQDKASRWNGIICYEGIVTGLHLKSMGLSGNVDVDALSNLVGLRTISLEDNKFSGIIPQFNRLGALKAIYLSKNEFSGQISPEYFSKMLSLKKLWLANNKFSGEIPSSLVKLRHLIELHIENNQFSGSIPPFTQPPLVSIDLSNNQLTGEIPKTLSNFKASSFGGNPSLCGEIVGKDCNVVTNKALVSTGSNNSNKVDKNGNTKIVATGVTIGVVLLSLVVIVACVTKRKRDRIHDIPTAYTKPVKGKVNTKATSKASDIVEDVVEVEVTPTLGRKSNASSTHSSKRSNSSRRGSGRGHSSVADLTMINEEKGVFGLGDLMKASAEVLGNGAMGSAYKAVMSNGLSVAVKRMRELNKLEFEEFDEEMRKLASLRHKNILPPLAYHYRNQEKLVVYEYVAKGSLHFILHGDRGITHAELNWPTRLKIIKGITEGLCYLHSELAGNDLPHGNLKSSNILIDLQIEPLLSDFGFNTMMNPNAASTGLFAYRSPEAIKNQTVSPKSDLFCLGVVILEILTCKFPTQYLSTTKGGTDVVQWVASAIAEGRESGLLDTDMMLNATHCKENMVAILRIGASCTEQNPDSRPSLSEVMEKISRVYDQDCGSQDARTNEVLPSPRDVFNR